MMKGGHGQTNPLIGVPVDHTSRAPHYTYVLVCVCVCVCARACVCVCVCVCVCACTQLS